MRSFAAIATIATFAFSAFTSAIPTPGGLPVLSDLGLLDVDAIVSDIGTCISNVGNFQLNGVNLGGTQQNNARQLPPLPAVPDPNSLLGGGKKDDRRGIEPQTPQGIPDVLVAATSQIVPLVQDLVAKITVDIEVEVALKLAIEVLGEIKVILDGVVAQIKVIIGGDISTVLCLEGKVLDLQIVAKLLANLIAIVVLALGLVVKICASIDITALLKIVVDISGVLAVIIGLVLKVAGGLLVILVPLLQVVVKVIIGLKLTALVSILGIHL